MNFISVYFLELKISLAGGRVLPIIYWLLFFYTKMIVKIILLKEKVPFQKSVLENDFSKRNHNHRVLLYSQDCSESSGAFRSCAALALHLIKQNNFDVIVGLANHGKGEDELNKSNIPYTVIESKGWLVSVNSGKKRTKNLVENFIKNHNAIKQIVKLIKSQNINIVHVNSMSTYVAGVAALYAKVPLVWHMRDLLEEDHLFKIYNRNVGLKLIRKSNKTIAVSECVREKYASIFGEDKVVKILNGVDKKRFYKPQKTIFNDKIATFVFVGGFQIIKGQIEFSKACAELFRKGERNFRVWFVGPDFDKIKIVCDNIFKTVGMESLVTYWGKQDAPEDFLEKSDIAFVCSRCEAFGRVTVEMMLSGCLVIGSDTGGTKELIEDEKTGLLYHYIPGECSDLPDKMIYALQHKEHSREMASTGRATMVMNMTAERNANEVARLYNELLCK